MDAPLFEHVSDSMQTFLNQLGLVFFKEDHVFFVYAPNLDVCGYGLTEKEARHSFLETFEAFLEYTKKNKSLEGELLRLGWEKLPTVIPSFYHQSTPSVFEPFDSRFFDYN
jgi:hypothetical protein